MRRIVLATATMVACLIVTTQPRAALDLSTPSEAQPITIGGKITVYPGGRVVLRNVDITSLPPITVRANGTVIIGGDARTVVPAARR